MKYIFTSLLIFISLSFFSQNYLLNGTTNNTTISTCTGNFNDSGGAGGSYGNSQDYTITFCPTTPGNKINLLFTAFATENGYDFMYIYDGPNTGSPSLGVYSGTAVTPIGNVQATASNTSGCITIRFHSDGSVTAAGWAAVISCITPCQTINSVFNSSSPAPVGGIIKICQGQSVTFNGSGTFSSSGAGAAYTWDFDNGQTGSGTTATTTYTAPGVYVVNLNINKSGCINYNKINQIVQVSTTPSFSATTTSTNSICIGQSATLIGSVTPTPFIVNCSPPTAGTTFLPDGSGVSYQSCLTVDCYGSSQTVTSMADIGNICINIEHSFLDDLDMIIQCPNGQQVSLKDDVGGGGTYLGNPIDDVTSGPGTGFTYCFDMSGTALLINGPTVTSGSPAGPSIAAGTYSPAASFAGLIGCPLNGGWCLKITDHAAIDDGYIFNWDINFNATVPASQSFTPTIVSQTWSGPNITSTSGNNAIITPTATGSYCYTLTAVDNFGCSYTTVRCVTVTPGPNAGVSNTLAVCNSAAASNLFSLLGIGALTTGSWTGPTPSLTGGYLGTFNPAGLASGAYNYTYTVPGSGACPPATAVVSVTIRPNPLATLTATNPSCGSTNGQVFINNSSCCAQTITSFASSLGAVSGQTVTGLGAGTPIITLTNSFGCTYTVSTTLSSATGPSSITITPTNANCGNNNGSFTFGSPIGGTSPYVYSINGGAFSATSPTTGLAPGTYSVTVKDAGGCTYTSTTTISNIAGPTAIAGTSSPASCAGATGSYTVTGVTGGSAAYTYSVDGGAFSGATTFSGLASGTHTITVKDANGCFYTTTFSVGIAAGINSALVNASTASCGQSNATATVSAVTGGVPTYSYSYDGGAYTSSSTTTGLPAGNHTVVIMDANTCTLSVLYTVVSLGSPTTSITSFSNVTCFGLANGSCTVAIPTGGAGAPFTYSLTAPLQTNGNGQFSGLPPGTYNISVQDVAGCVATTSVVITQPTQLSLNPSSFPVNCFGSATGTINLSGSGGTPAYTYNLNGGTYQGSTIFANQSAGSYLMGIKDANGCVSTQTIAVTQPPALAITVASQNANCTTANGVGSATVTGGTGFITYTWNPSGGAAATSNSVATGNYTVTATDANGCVISSPVSIGVTLGGTASITASTNITCNGLCNGSMTAGMIGGTAPFTYSWTPGGQTTAVASNLCSGTYSCTITDFYGCKSTAFGTITQPSALTPIMNSQNVKCYNTPTGTVSVAGSGGQSPYSYSWPTLASTLTTVSNVASGNYDCITTDANGCSITTSITVTQPTSITLTSSVTAANCNQPNGSATIIVSGGIPAYTQTWSASGSPTTAAISGQLAGTYSVQIKDANNCLQALTVTIPNLSGPSISITSQTNVSCYNGNNGVATTSVTGGVAPYIYTWSNGLVTPNGTNLTAQLYTVSATDQAGCIASTSVNILQPTALTVTISPTQPTCFGATNGLGTAAAFGGTPNYTYAWTVGGNGSITTPLGAGNYGLTVTDGNGCIITSSMVLTNPPAMAASITSTNVTCFNACNGLAVATTTNGIGVVSYVWTGGATPVSSQTLTGACAGSFTVLATDQNFCTANAVVNITEPAQITANISSTGSVTCYGGNNGFAVVTPAGGNGAYTYTWSPSGGNSATASSLTAGSYIATITDATGCSASATATIIQSSAFTTTLTTTNVNCNAACDGTGNIAFSGGVGIPTFLWEPGLQSGNSVNNLCAGNQTVTITSNGACTSVLTFTLTEPTALTAIISTTNSNCGQANGSACVVVGGGTSPYGSLWTNGITTMCNNNIIAGPYTYTVTDANNCKTAVAGLINDISGPLVTVTSSTNVSCFNGTDGAAITSVSGGVPPYTFMWAGTQTFTTQNISGLTSGIKSIAVTDAAGCVGSASVNIIAPAQLVSAIASFTNVTCFGYNNGGASILVNGGTANYSYTWTPSAQTSSVLTSVGPNTYTCNITDANGCATTQIVSIIQPQSLVMSASSFSPASCFGQANGQISTSFQGGTQPYAYTWTPAQPNSGIITGILAGNYALSVSDANNCVITSNFTILEPSALTSTYTSLPATCGLANGSATLNIGGGSPSYSVNWNTAPPQSGLIATNMSPGTNWQAVITDAHGCSLTQPITVPNALPPTITGFNVLSPTCFGLTNGTVTVNYVDGTAPYTVSWQNPISQTLTTSALTSSVMGVSAGLYNVNITDNNGCSTAQPVNVTQPNMLVLVTTPNVTICYGQSTQISASASGGTPAYTYSWTPNTLSGSGPHTVNPTTATSYSVLVSDINGCSPSLKIININVTPQLSVVGNSITLCHGAGGLLTPTITSPGNGGPYNYTWSPITASTSSIIVLGNAPTNVTTNTISLTLSDGCSLPDAIAVFTVVANPLPTVTFTASMLEACAPASIDFLATPGVAGNYSYVWYYENKDMMGTTNPVTYNFATADSVTIKLVITNTVTGCTNTEIKTNYILINKQPIASFYANPRVTSILDPNINFINTSQGAVSYFWDFGDVTSVNGLNNSSATNPSHYYNSSGVYNVHLIATSIKGCKDTAEVIVEIKPDFAIYIPNAFTPDENGTNDIFQPIGVGINEDKYQLDIFDRWGENVFTSDNFRKGWDGTVKGSTKPVPQGVYVYKLMVYDLQGNKHPFVGHVTVIRQN